tara:strand:+ start:190 stop:1182 length:993 start_codon:yes stop_codon:yes gene_type:complete
MSLRHLRSTQTSNNLLDSGRESLSTILKIINESNKLYNQLLIPTVICNDIIPIIQSYGLTIKYYPVDDKLRPDFNYIEKELVNHKSILLVVNYFGFLSKWDEVKKLQKLYDIISIEDNAHTIYLNQNNKSIGSFGDFSFNSFRKLLPVSSGSLLRINNERFLKYDINITKKFLSFADLKLILRPIMAFSNINMQPVKTRQIIKYDNKKIYSSDYISRRLIPYLMKDISYISTKRQKNYISWYNFLKDRDVDAIFDIDKDTCPYVFACYANNSKSANNWITWGRQNNINITRWPDFPTINHKDISESQHNILFFPVNHQINISEILNEKIS